MNNKTFRSLKTKEKLLNIEVPDPKIKYSTEKEIDDFFKDCCEKVRNNLESHVDPSSKVRSSMKNNNSEQFETKVKELYTHNVSNSDYGAINPVVNFFGNSLIAAVFQALMIKVLEDLYGVKFQEEEIFSSRFIIFFYDFNDFLKIVECLWNLFYAT